MTDPTNAAPGIAAGLSNAIASAPDSASPVAPAPQGAPPSKAEEGNWYAKVDAAPGDTRADPADPGDGSGKPPPDGQPKAQPDGIHGEPPSPLHEALPPRTYAEFKLPEGTQVKIDPGALRQFTETLDASRGDHQGAGQRLFDLHLAEIQKVGENMLKYQRDVWNRTIETRINELKADPELGGSRIETVLGNAKYVIEDFGGLSKAEQSELLSVWDNGGVSNHRLTVKFLNNIFKRFQPPQPVQPNNPAASKLMSAGGGRDWYSTVDKPGAR